MINISQLFIYPIKSLAGISVASAAVTEKGLQYDRRWMLVDGQNQFMTQRKHPHLALIQPVLETNGMRIKSLNKDAGEIFIPFAYNRDALQRVTIWNATCEAYSISSEIDDWFTQVVGMSCKLVYMPDETLRPVDTSSGKKPQGKFTSFSDAYPFLLMSEESIEDLNRRSGRSFTIERFRPNLVVSGGLPYQEDDFSDFQIGGVTFQGLEKCARCSVPNIDPKTGIPAKDQEPTRTLTSYRREGNNIYLGMNLVHSGRGTLAIGDQLVF
jgi:uncharacterized protein YcbX